VWFLSRKGIRPSKELLNEKLKLYDERFNVDKLGSILKEIESDWQTDLQALLPQVPDFSNVAHQVIDTFSRLYSEK